VCGCSQNADLTARKCPEGVHEPVQGKVALKPRALQPGVSSPTRVLGRVVEERAGTPPLLLDFVLIYERVTTADHGGEEIVSMGYILERSYEIAAEKWSVAWAQALLCTPQSRSFSISKGLQAQQVGSCGAEVLRFGLRL